jgi:hypothetical protein
MDYRGKPINCPSCMGTGLDSKKRRNVCPQRFCVEGKIYPDAMCSCVCHESPALHASPCCYYSGMPREELEDMKSLARGIEATS